MVIACIDFSNDGHRLYLMRSVIKAILESGHTAICVTNDTDEIKIWIDEFCTEHRHHAIYYTYNYKQPSGTKWNIHLNDILIALQYWKQYHSILKNIEKGNQLKIDAVLINYIDVFLSCKMPLFLQKKFFHYRWAGLYIHTRYLRMFKHLGVQTKKARITDIDYLFKSDKCIGVGVFDAGTHQALAYRLDKKVTLIPDTSDVSTDTKTYALADEIKLAAKGRLIIGTIGISAFMGVVDLIKLAISSADKDYFFVFCGSFDPTSYDTISNDIDKELLRKFRENPTKNCIWKEGYLENEFEYNAVFKAFDIVYMMYPNHFTSSNRLTKAAFFNKLVLASNQHCVGENVMNYKLGEVAASGNITQQLEKLDALYQKIKSESYPIEEWKKYYSLNNEPLLQKQLKSLLNI